MPDPAAVNSMFARIAARYDIANMLLSGGMDRRWRRRLVAAATRSNPNEVLDLAAGSGDVTFALSRKLPPSASIIGVDFCAPMLRQAETKKRAAGEAAYSNVEFRQGDVMALPIASGSVSAVTIAFGLRNLADRNQGLREMHRVLRPGGRLFVLEFSQPRRWLRPFYYFYLRRILPVIAGGITGDRSAYVYLNDTIAEFPDRSELSQEIIDAGFAGVRAYPMTCGIVALHEASKSPVG
jgi:demethylmenaquinone methyltransferase/2-methoxy-6-polyprenyl-1,4-benzoquinol methylase